MENSNGKAVHKLECPGVVSIAKHVKTKIHPQSGLTQRFIKPKFHTKPKTPGPNVASPPCLSTPTPRAVVTEHKIQLATPGPISNIANANQALSPLPGRGEPACVCWEERGKEKREEN